MKLCELVKESKWDEIWPYLKAIYEAPNSDYLTNNKIEDLEVIDKSVWVQLKNLEPTKSDFKIGITKVIEEDDGEVWWDVHGVKDVPFEDDGQGGMYKGNYAIEYTDWVEWLASEIHEDTLKEFSHAEIVAHCIYEMSFAGFTPEEIKKKRQEILDIHKEFFDQEKNQ